MFDEIPRMVWVSNSATVTQNSKCIKRGKIFLLIYTVLISNRLLETICSGKILNTPSISVKVEKILEGFVSPALLSWKIHVFSLTAFSLTQWRARAQFRPWNLTWTLTFWPLSWHSACSSYSYQNIFPVLGHHLLDASVVDIGPLWVGKGMQSCTIIQIQNKHWRDIWSMQDYKISLASLLLALYLCNSAEPYRAFCKAKPLPLNLGA